MVYLSKYRIYFMLFCAFITRMRYILIKMEVSTERTNLRRFREK